MDNGLAFEDIDNFERSGEQERNDENRNEDGEDWGAEMAGVEYNADLQWATTPEEYRELAERGAVDEAEGEYETGGGLEQLGGDLVKAGDAMSFGLNTASEVFGLETVLAAVKNVDETGRDAMNPLGAIYGRLAQTPEVQQYLYAEMRKDFEQPQGGPAWLAPRGNNLRIGRNAKGEFYELDPATGWPENNTERSVAMLQALKRLIEALETNERFENLRQRASEAGMEPLDYLLQNEVNPTLKDFLEKASEAAEIDVDRFVEELARGEEEKTEEIEMDESAAGMTDAASFGEGELGEIRDL